MERTNHFWFTYVTTKTAIQKWNTMAQSTKSQQSNIPFLCKTHTPLKKDKYEDLQKLAKFCFCSEAAALYCRTATDLLQRKNMTVNSVTTPWFSLSKLIFFQEDLGFFLINLYLNIILSSGFNCNQDKSN